MQHHVYSAFGKLLKVEDGNGNDVTDAPVLDPYFTFTGREYDKETQLYYYRARYYDPALGRFLQVDPDPGALTAPLSVTNKYTYCANNPVMITDPSGMFWKELGIAFAAVTIGLLTGGTAFGPALLMAAEAVGASVLGSAVIAGATSLATGENFWQVFDKVASFQLNMMTVSAIGGTLFGGGLTGAGSNKIFQGYVQSDHGWFGLQSLEGGLTFGSTLNMSGAGVGAQSAAGTTFAIHEFGHFVQYVGLSAAMGRNRGRNAYFGLGILGLTPAGGWWENMATSLGGIF